MRGVNKVIIVGNLGNDPVVKQFDNGGMIANLSVATSEKWNARPPGELREVTEWHRIVFNNKLAEIAAQYLRKGSQVYIEGKLKTRKYQDQSGQDRYITEIHADQMQMLGSRSDDQPQAAQQQQNTYARTQPQPQPQPPRQPIYDNVPF